MKYHLEPDNRNCTDETLLADLRLVATNIGKKSISIGDYEARGRFSSATVKKRFGTWNNALMKSGLEVGRRINVTQSELLLDLKAVSKKLQKNSVTTKEYSEFGNFSVPTISKSFGSWNKALTLAELKISPNWKPKVSEDELFSNLARVWEAIGRQPRQGDMASPNSHFSVDTYKRRYGSLRNALKKFVDYANEPNTELTEKNDLSVLAKPTPAKIKHTTHRNPSWRLRFLVNRRDRFACCACGLSPANDVGVILHIDHIVPWSGNPPLFN